MSFRGAALKADVGNKKEVMFGSIFTKEKRFAEEKPMQLIPIVGNRSFPKRIMDLFPRKLSPIYMIPG